MKPFTNDNVAAVFAGYPTGYPTGICEHRLDARGLVFEVAQRDLSDVGTLEEALRWGEPAYLTPQTKSGSTMGLAWREVEPDVYGVFFICTTDLLDTFRALFADELVFEGERAILGTVDVPIPPDALAYCVEAGLMYRLRKRRERRQRG
ncbi:MAG: hypothetical protein ACI8PT_000892 [Gammaproteobacteria bacterium]|jgi:hypothetical protein